jgi:hypothetical protein
MPLSFHATEHNLKVCALIFSTKNCIRICPTLDMHFLLVLAPFDPVEQH